MQWRQEWRAAEKRPQSGGRVCKVSFNPLCPCGTKRSRCASNPFNSCSMHICSFAKRREEASSGVKPFNTSARIKARCLSFDFFSFFFFLFGRRLNICCACVCLCCLFLVMLFFRIFFVTCPSLEIQPRSLSARVLWLECAACSCFL